MPPVLHVAFFELMLARQHDLVACDLRPAVNNGHHVLQLIAKTISAARLIERGASPDATRKSLIDEPAIEHRVQRRVGRSYFDRAEQTVPVVQHLFKRGVDVGSLAESRDGSLCRFFRLRFAEQKDHFARFIRRELDLRLKRRARIEAGALAARETDTFQRGGSFEQAVAADELLAIAGGAREWFARRYERRSEEHTS